MTGVIDVLVPAVIPKALDAVLKQNTKNLTGATIGTLAITSAVIGIILNIIPILRELTYFFYYSRTKVADYFDAPSALLQMNAYNLASKASNSDKDVTEIQNKQLKIAEKFKKIANFISVKHSKAEVASEKETKDLEKKLKISDVKDSDPNNTDSLW